ncbi:MAG: ribosomal protein S18-alanine N-acetyltransferase [Enterobacteriaceae bacterium]
MIEISSLHSHDLPGALQIERACQEFPWSEKLFYSNQGERYINLKLQDDKGNMAAFAITQQVLDEATLFNLAVHPTHQRHGYGTALLQHLIPLLQERGVSTLWLEVRASNLPAITLYEKLGFNQVTVRKGYYPAQQGREDAWVMALML